MNFKPSLTYKEFSAYAKQGNLIPLYLELPADLDTPVSAFQKIKTGKYGFLFESVEGGENWGRYSFLGSTPSVVFKSKGKKATLIQGKMRSEFEFKKDPLEVLEFILKDIKPVPMVGLPRFYGGMVGYLSYDAARFFESIPSTAKDDLKIPEAYFMLTDEVFIFDNLRQVIQVVVNVRLTKGQSLKKAYDEAVYRLKKMALMLQKPLTAAQRKLNPLSALSVDANKLPLKANRTEPDYCVLVEKAKEYIKSGDIFQVQISTRFEGKTTVAPFDLYRNLRRVTPTPYLYYLHFPEMAVVGASPELMVRLEDGVAEVRPIAGTRRRGKNADEDSFLENELKNDPKERAEHIMLVDLGRNDLGRVCEVGTVHVSELECVEKYSHVMHLVSQVSGKLARNKTPFDLIRATFPAGTLTGAPKIRSMEIIEELEGVRRGIYGGGVGYIGFSGNVDMAIAIRTALYANNKIYVQAAGGVVYDSVPRLEYKEFHNKAKAMRTALALAAKK